MKNRASLVLIEQMILLLVFALAAVLCLRVFLWADLSSEEGAARDQALVQAQSAVEVLKACGGDFEAAAEMLGGDWDGTVWVVFFDGQWAVTHEGQQAAYILRVVPEESGLKYLGGADVGVFRGEECLASLSAAWQEVD